MRSQLPSKSTSESPRQSRHARFWNSGPTPLGLEAKGFKQLIAMEDLALELGATGKIAMLGYGFSEAWGKAHLETVRGFLRAAAKANRLLATSDEAWQRLRPLMRAKDDATFQALKRHYREGIPQRSIAANEADAKILYQLLRELGGETLVGTATELVPGTFWKDPGMNVAN
jgi:NitT/TauT family transport system substrate-binding protein